MSTDLAASPGVGRLRARLVARQRELGTRLLTEPAEAAAAAEAVIRAYEATVGHPPILRRAAALREFAETCPLSVDPEALLVGSQAFNPLWSAPAALTDRLRELGYAASTGHIVHDYAVLLHLGIAGLRECVRDAAPHWTTTDQKQAGQAFEQALDAFARFIERQAEAVAPIHPQWAAQLRDLAVNPPRTFPQALQMVWFAQIFLHAENPSMAISFGRLDQYLWPYLQADLATARMNLPEAFDWLCAFYLKCCEGDESQNLTVGGVTEDGRDAANPLSVLLLRAMAALQVPQPSLTVRWHPLADLVYRQAACDLAACGTGQPGFMNDGAVIPALRQLDLSLEQARDWAVVGCYEAVPQGAAYANTVLGGLHLPQTLTACLADTAAPDFESFVDGWLCHLQATYESELERAQRSWDRMAEFAPSPFGSLLMQGCIAALTPLEAGGAHHSFAGINLQGLATVVDSLHAIRELVYTTRELSLPELAAALADDFPHEDLRQRLRHLPGRYGTDNPATNELAAAISEHIAQMVLDSRLEHGVRPYPGFFRFSGDIYDLRCPSPDGRRQADLISYGVGPASCVQTSTTAVLRSAAAVAHDRCACGNPLALTLPVGDHLTEGETADLISQLVETYFDLGGCHVHFNTVAAPQMRAAVEQPAEHRDLMVRVSGFSAAFVTLDPRWQQALIERAEVGL
jgi:pyruvate-formate lyase